MSAWTFDLSQPPITIASQGARSFGGTVMGDPAKSSTHVDHGYVEWQIPVNARTTPLLMWHSSSTKTWETTFDNREGFKNIFLRHGFPVFMIDAPRLGRAGAGAKPYTYEPKPGTDQSRYTSFRLGLWLPPAEPIAYPGVQFPVHDPAALAELFRTDYPEFNTPDGVQVETNGVTELLRNIQPSVLFTHSGSGIRGWWTAIKSDGVAGIISYEPNRWVFPEGEVPPPIPRSDGQLIEAPNPPLGSAVPLEQFKRLTRMPIQIVMGDNIPAKMDSANVGARLILDNWRIRIIANRLFVEAINRHGGNAELVVLPDIGIRGNTHFPMSDTNNAEIAELAYRFLTKHGLAGGR